MIVAVQVTQHSSNSTFPVLFLQASCPANQEDCWPLEILLQFSDPAFYWGQLLVFLVQHHMAVQVLFFWDLPLECDELSDEESLDLRRWRSDSLNPLRSDLVIPAGVII